MEARAVEKVRRAGPPTEQEVRAFVGPNADYYLRAWRPDLFGEVGGVGFNLAAFFLSGLWLGYRKMYSAVFAVFGVFVIGEALQAALFSTFGSVRGVSTHTGLVVAVVVCACGNGWYLSRARRVIAEVRARGLPPEEHLRALAARGGTSVGGALGASLVFLLMMSSVAFDLSIVLRRL